MGSRGMKILEMALDKNVSMDDHSCLSENENGSESELDTEQERIAKEMEEFISFSTSGSEYFPESQTSMSSEFSMHEDFRKSLEKEENEKGNPIVTTLTPAAPLFEYASTSASSQIDHVSPVLQQSMPDFSAQYQKKNAARERPTICPLCFEDVPTHFPRHIFRAHKDNKDVIALQNLKPRSKERLQYLRGLRKQGYFVMKTERNVLRPMKSSKNPSTEYFPCSFCLGHYSKKLLFKHVKVCESKPKDIKHAGRTCQADSQTFTASLVAQNQEFMKHSRLKEEVFCLMRADDVSYAAKSDPLACLYGEALLNKHKRKQISTVISNKLREMGRLLISLRTVDKEIVTLFDALKPEHFRSLLAATKIISGYNQIEKCFSAPSLALHMGTNLKFLCNIGLKLVLENRSLPTIKWTDREQKKSEIKDLKKLIEGHWCTEISSLALKTLKERHWEKPSHLPLNSDIQLFQQFVNNESERAFLELKNNKDIEANYKTLTECVLAQTLMFNRKRIGEIQYLTVERYESNTDNVNRESFMDSLTHVEKLICKKFKRVVTGGKGFKPVPILFSKKLQEYISLMLKVRKEKNIVPETNPYIFANPASEERSMSGASKLRKFAQKCGAQEPNLLTSTRFRKHIATTLQLMTLEDNEMEQIATFMGHTKKTHEEFYRLPQDIYQTAKVAKVLLLLEKGKGKEFKGKRLNDIELDEDVYLTTDSENEDNNNNEQDATRKFVGRMTKKKETALAISEISPEAEDGYNGDKENDSLSKNLVEDTIGCASSKYGLMRSNINCSSSSDDEGSQDSSRKLKRLKVSNRKRWSEREKRLVTTHFKDHIAKKIAPKKHECETFLSSNKEISTDKCWVRVKTFVYNTYRQK